MRNGQAGGRMRRVGALAAAVLALGGVAAACGDDDDDAGSTAANSAPAASAPADTAAAPASSVAPAGEFGGTKSYLLSQTAQLSDWTAQFAGLGQQYYDLAK